MNTYKDGSVGWIIKYNDKKYFIPLPKKYLSELSMKYTNILDPIYLSTVSYTHLTLPTK